MNTRILLILALFIASMSVASAVNYYCCPTSCQEFTDPDALACDEPVESGRCNDIDAFPACLEQGCCVDDSGDAQLKTKYDCALASGTFHEDIDEQDQCAALGGDDPLSESECDTAFAESFEVRVENVFGSSELRVAWPLCTSVTSVTLERSVRGEEWIEVETSGVINQHTDDTEWNTNYRYRVVLRDNTGVEVARDTSRSINTGDERCDGATATSFCDADKVVTCTQQNQYSERACPSGCEDLGLGARCRAVEGACELGYPYLNVARSSACDELSEDGSVCYYDRSSTGINRCYDCAEVVSCFDFKSNYTCRNAGCPHIQNCEWVSSGGGLGDGICKPTDDQSICRYLTDPEGTVRQELYSPLLTPTTHASSISWFSTEQNRCDEIGNVCAAGTESTCPDINTGTDDYSCAWRSSYGYCGKYLEETTPYFADTSGALCDDARAQSTCEQDSTRPRLSISRTVNWDEQEVEYTLRVEDPEPVTDLSGYTFSICYDTGTNVCRWSDDHSIRSVDPNGVYRVSFSDLGVVDAPTMTTFSAIVRDRGFNIGNLVRLESSVDPTNPQPTLTVTRIEHEGGHLNDRVRVRGTWIEPGSGVVKIGDDTVSVSNDQERDFTKQFEYDEPYEAQLIVTRNDRPYPSERVVFTLEQPPFLVTITEPERGGIRGAFTARAEPSETASTCQLGLTTTDTSPSHWLAMDRDGNAWTWTGTRSEDGWLHVRCEQQAGTRVATASRQLYYVAPGAERPRINRVDYPETIVFADADGQYSADVRVYTDRPTTCAIGTSQSAGGLDDEHTITLAFTDIGDYEREVICTDAVGQESTPWPITITVDPASEWFAFIKPSGLVRANTIEYRISTGASGLEARCAIPELGLTSLTGDDLSGTFNPEDHEAYEGEGTYTLTAECIGRSGTGTDTGLTTQTTTFTIDTKPPSVTARINALTSRIELTEPPIPTNTFVRFDYADENGVHSLTYTIEKTNDSNTWTTIREETLRDLGDGPRTVPFGFALEDQTEYRVRASVTDTAGNTNETTSNRLIVTLPDPCHTGEICGGDCGATCDIGDVCTTNADCAGGEQVICTDAGFCDYAHCYNNRMDEDKGETGVDCGGVCGACTITLVEPSFGVSATRETRVVINTTETMLCEYTDGVGGPYSFAENEPSRTHTIRAFDVINTPSINVSCLGDQTSEWNVFTFTHDPRRPEIIFQANPDIEGRKSTTSQGSVYATTFTARSTNDVPIICRVSETNTPYHQMTEFLGKDYRTDRDESAYRNVQNEEFGFKDAGTYRLYVDCLAKNGLTSGVTSATFTADPDGSPAPRIVVPAADRIYSEESIRAVVDARSIQAQACYDQLATFDVREMTLAQGTVYERDVNLIEGERIRYRAVCEYIVSGLSTNGTSDLRFTVDRTPPEIESVTIRDPRTENTSTLTTPNGVEIVIVARDETTYIARYEYEIRVNGELVSQGLRMRNRIVDNELSLNEGDRVHARITVTDAAGNAASEESNTLTYTVVPPPAICEEEGLCGGDCPPCEDIGDACEIDTDCTKGLYCLDGACADRDTICTNERFDPDYETAKDCGGICEPCEEGASCTTHSDCGSNQYCASDRTCKKDYQAICSNEEHDSNYESGVDCGGVCQELFGQTCGLGESCNTNADCTGTAICKGGVCTADYAPPTNDWCSEDRFNNTLEDGGFCGRDCPERCPEGVGCQLTSDCASGLVCITGVCEEEKKDDKDTCLFPTDSNPPPCGGDCDPCGLQRMCNEDSDCTSGECRDGHCARGEVVEQPITQPTPRGGLDQACRAGGECNDGLRCNDENVCVSAPSIWRWIIFILLFVLLGVAGYIAYRYYYLPHQKPDYQEGQLIDSETANTPFDEHTTAEPSVNPPSAPPVMTDKQQHVSELIREKRAAKKKEEREELFSAFDESALDEEPAQPKDVPKTKLPTKKDDEKPIVATRKKSHDSFKEILDEAKDEHE